MDKRSIIFMACMTLAFFGVQYFWAPEKKPVQAVDVEISTKPIEQTVNIVSSDESFYVLENEYQQLVFSSKGGSLAEINLPFKSPSYVKEIDFDRLIAQQSPDNAYFPLSSYTTFDKVVHEKGQFGGYYPLLRRSIVGKSKISPEYYALTILDNSNDIKNFTVTKFEKNLIEFRGQVGGRTVTKTYSIPEEQNGPYCFDLKIDVDGSTEGLWLSSGLPDVEIVANAYSPNLRIQITKNISSEVESVDLPKKGAIQINDVTPNWISNCNGFFGIIMDPLKQNNPGYKLIQVPGYLAPTRLTLIDPEHSVYPEDKYPGYMTYLPLKKGNFRIFAGPYDTNLLKTIDKLYDEPLKNYTPDYVSALSIQGWFSFISQPFSKFLNILIELFYFLSHSWAVSIVLLTLALRVIMYPLNNWSARSNAKLQELMPKVQAIQERYKKDPKKGQLEVMNLYKQAGANPLGGCLPILLQIPFMIGMFYLLKSCFALRGAPFISGWIDDLSAPDILFSWNTPLPLIGSDFHLLPVLTALSMYYMTKLTAKAPKDPSKLTEQEQQQKIMSTVMPIMMLFLFYNFPSGLNLYFMFSNVFGMIQQQYVMKKLKLSNK